MKKIFLSIAVVVAFASIASAGTNVLLTTVTTLTFKPSANVVVFYQTDAGKQNYCLNSKHNAGDKIYSSTNTTSALWYKTAVAGTAATASDGITNPGESTYSGWSSL